MATCMTLPVIRNDDILRIQLLDGVHISNLSEEISTSFIIFRSDLSGQSRISELVLSITDVNYTEVLSSPLEVSGLDVIGIDVQCEATVKWNISIRRGVMLRV